MKKDELSITEIMDKIHELVGRMDSIEREVNGPDRLKLIRGGLSDTVDRRKTRIKNSG
jgi:hypothetical protein